MIDKTFRCDLCKDARPVFGSGSSMLVGIYWNGDGWVEKPRHEVEHHICCKCLSSLQRFEQRCGQGFECNGGPTCGSDHK